MDRSDARRLCAQVSDVLEVGKRSRKLPVLELRDLAALTHHGGRFGDRPVAVVGVDEIEEAGARYLVGGSAEKLQPRRICLNDPAVKRRC